MTVEILNNPDITLPRPAEPINEISLDWKDNSAVLSLLDVVVQILAEEYIETAKNNPEIFKNISDSTDSNKITQIKREVNYESSDLR